MTPWAIHKQAGTTLASLYTQWQLLQELTFIFTDYCAEFFNTDFWLKFRSTYIGYTKSVKSVRRLEIQKQNNTFLYTCFNVMEPFIFVNQVFFYRKKLWSDSVSALFSTVFVTYTWSALKGLFLTRVPPGSFPSCYPKIWIQFWLECSLCSDKLMLHILAISAWISYENNIISFQVWFGYFPL